MLGRHRLSVRPANELEGDTAGFALGHASVDDADHLAPARAAGGKAHLAAGSARSFMHHDIVPALGGHPRRLEPGRARPDHNHPARLLSHGDIVRHGQFAAGCGVVRAEGRATRIDAVEAIVRTDSGADVVFAARQYLAHDMRVSHVGASSPPCRACRWRWSGVPWPRQEFWRRGTSACSPPPRHPRRSPEIPHREPHAPALCAAVKPRRIG